MVSWCVQTCSWRRQKRTGGSPICPVVFHPHLTESHGFIWSPTLWVPVKPQPSVVHADTEIGKECWEFPAGKFAFISIPIFWWARETADFAGFHWVTGAKGNEDIHHQKHNNVHLKAPECLLQSTPNLVMFKLCIWTEVQHVCLLKASFFYASVRTKRFLLCQHGR